MNSSTTGFNKTQIELNRKCWFLPRIMFFIKLRFAIKGIIIVHGVQHQADGPIKNVV